MASNAAHSAIYGDLKIREKKPNMPYIVRTTNPFTMTLEEVEAEFKDLRLEHLTLERRLEKIGSRIALLQAAHSRRSVERNREIIFREPA